MDSSALHSAAETCLTWIGFGFVCGVSAKAVLPGRDPGGAIVTLILGIGGALIGAAIYAWAAGHALKGLISLPGFGVAIGGALVLLLAHRLLSGRMFGRPRIVEDVILPDPIYSRRRRRTARYSDLD